MNDALFPTQADLQSHPVLSDLDAEFQQAMLERARVFTPARDDILFHAGDPVEWFFLCRSGQLKLYRLSPEGNEKIIALIGPGSSFAEAAVFMDSGTYPVNCTALQPSVLIAFDAEHFREGLRHSPDACFRLIGKLSQRLRNRVGDIEALSLQNAQLRVINYLMRLNHEQGDQASFRLPSSKKHIAGLLAIQPETLSRVFAQLQDAGILRVKGSEIEVLDRDRLKRAAEGQELTA